MFRRNLRIVAVLAASIALCVSFENCAGGFSGTSNSNSLGLVTNNATSDPTPFAYDATYDQISYNSCFGSGATSPAFTTLQAGAYDSGGVWITNTFFAYINANLKPEFPATTISAEQVKDLLSNSAVNTTAMPQMALRTQGSPQNVYSMNGVTPVPQVDFVTLLGDLTDDRWSDPLVTSMTNVMYFNLAPTYQRSLEGSLSYLKDSPTSQAVRNALTSGGMLALTFTAAAPNVQYGARPVGTDQNIVNGRGYLMNYAQQIAPFSKLIASYGGGAPYINNPEQLTAIREVDLRAPSSVAKTWTCIPDREYVVVRAADAPTFCPRDNYTDTITGFGSLSAAQYRRELDVVRRHLKAEYWDVSIERRCVVPKTGSCYADADAERLPDGTTPQIQYDQTQPCFRPDGNYPTNPIPTAWCAQYVSFCTRGPT